MSPGPLMLDLSSVSVTPEEQEMLTDPMIGGVILFSRNYQSPSQLDTLVGAIREVRSDLIIAVDHEGGRVQRFREGFTLIPPMRHLGELYRRDAQAAVELAEQLAWLMAAELLVHDVDLSFAPVLDIDHAVSEVIGDRAFSADPEEVTLLARAFIAGFHRAGMAATGKHFPGHGGVAGDSHTEIPVDERTLSDIESSDLIPFSALLDSLDALMPAHVIYTAVDRHPAGFSKIWLQQILRNRFGFEGVIFSDDLSMEGASVAGGYEQRAEAALEAGCDMLLVCNNRSGAQQVLRHLNSHRVKASPRLGRLKHHGALDKTLFGSSAWREAVAAVTALV